LLDASVFQGELLVSEANFTAHFPTRSGYAYFLGQSPPEMASTAANTLERILGDHGFDVTSTAEKLARYESVENTYLATFQTVGGLGLLLGTLGLATLVVRNVVERRGELATLRACGFTRTKLSRMLLVENGLPLVVGIAIGSLSAVVATTPSLLASGGRVSWASLLFTLAVVFLVGVGTSSGAAHFALRASLLPALKAD